MGKFLGSLGFFALALGMLFLAVPSAEAQRRGPTCYIEGRSAPRHACEEMRRREEARRYDRYNEGRRGGVRGDFGRGGQRMGEHERGGGSYRESENFNCRGGSREECERSLYEARERRDDTLFIVNADRGCAIGWRRDVPPRIRDRHMREARELQRQCQGGARGYRDYDDYDRRGRRRGSEGTALVVGIIIGVAACAASGDC
jgi:hypothetical protein